MSEALKEQIARLGGYFNKVLTAAQYREYEAKLQFIPQRALIDIVDAIIEARRPTPGAFPTPSRIRTDWYTWQKQNHHRAPTAQEYPECQDCNSTGLFWYYELDKDLGYEVNKVICCAACSNWKKHFNDGKKLKFATKQKMELYGIKLWGPQ